MRSRNAGRALLAEDFDGRGIAEPCAGAQGVGNVLGHAIVGDMAAAIPPWAKRVLLSSRRALVTSVTACLRLSSSAAMSPAIPLPTTMMCFMPPALMPALRRSFARWDPAAVMGA